MHRVVEKARHRDVAIPNNGVPLYIEHNMLYVTEIDNRNALEIVVYLLK